MCIRDREGAGALVHAEQYDGVVLVQYVVLHGFVFPLGAVSYTHLTRNAIFLTVLFIFGGMLYRVAQGDLLSVDSSSFLRCV